MDEIEEYVKNNYKTKGTKADYKYLLKRYFEVIDKKPEGYFKNKKNTKQYEDDVKKFFGFINNKERNTPPLTIRSYLSAIKTYLMMNDVEFKAAWWKANISNKMTGKGPRTRDTVPERAELKQILQHADCRGRAFFLTLSSSGMRIGELCKITIHDVHFNKHPVEIDILGEYTKAGERRLTFITDEAANALKEWLKIRQSYLDDIAASSNGRFTHYKINTKDERVFPFFPGSGRVMWEKYIKNAGFDDKDQSTKRFKMHPHTIRKWYITTMKQHIPVAVVDKIVGHAGYLSAEYDRFTEKDMARMYLEKCGHLAIFETVKEQDLTGVHDEIKALKQEKADMRKHIEEMDMQLRKLLIDKLTEDSKKKKV
jgi:integrase